MSPRAAFVRSAKALLAATRKRIQFVYDKPSGFVTA
jgi:hypothetical protein